MKDGLFDTIKFGFMTFLTRLSRRRWPRHPIDELYDIETSTRVSPRLLRSGDKGVDGENTGYVGSQPSVIRACIGLIPDQERFCFVDIGCGKGRVLVVASEFPFREIVGVDISGYLLARARANAGIVAKRFPGRTTLAFLKGDATRLPFADHGHCVLFLYNPFGYRLTERLVRMIESEIARRPDVKIFVMCYNPVHHRAFDESPVLARFAAENLPFSADEAKAVLFSNRRDSVVIWQSRNREMVPAHPGASRRVTITVPDYGADVELT